MDEQITDPYTLDIIKHLGRIYNVAEDEAIRLVRKHVALVTQAKVTGSLAYYAGHQIAGKENLVHIVDREEKE